MKKTKILTIALVTLFSSFQMVAMECLTMGKSFDVNKWDEEKFLELPRSPEEVFFAYSPHINLILKKKYTKRYALPKKIHFIKEQENDDDYDSDDDEKEVHFTENVFYFKGFKLKNKKKENYLSITGASNKKNETTEDLLIKRRHIKSLFITSALIEKSSKKNLDSTEYKPVISLKWKKKSDNFKDDTWIPNPRTLCAKQASEFFQIEKSQVTENLNDWPSALTLFEALTEEKQKLWIASRNIFDPNK